MSLPRVKGGVSPKAEVNYPIRMKGTRKFVRSSLITQG